jgi:hypothetical protein
MKGYKEPSFQDRTAAAAQAKNKALAKLKAKPAPDAAELAKQAAKAAEREAAAAEKRAALLRTREEARLAAEARAAEEAAAIAAAAPPVLTEAERKLARDAKYAARKNRKS